MVLVGVVGAVLLTDGVLEDADLSGYDPAVSAGFIAARSAALTVLAHVFTFAGSALALVPLTVVLLVWWGMRRRWHAVTALAAGMTMSLVLTVLLKSVVGRDRPPAVDVLGAINNGFAFPSGHTLNGTVFFGLVTGLVLTWCHTVGSRAAALAGGMTMVIGIGLSRIYLGYHWMTDVLGGWSLGVAVLGVVLLGALLLYRRQGSGVGPAIEGMRALEH